MKTWRKCGCGKEALINQWFLRDCPLVLLLTVLLTGCSGESGGNGEAVGGAGADLSYIDTISSEVPSDEQAGADGKTVILYFGDTQPEESIREYEALGDLIRKARAEAPDADFALQCGDITNTGGAPEEWSAFFEAVAPALDGLPLLTAPGNHEYTATAYDYGAKPETYLEAFALPENGPAGYTEEYYSFDTGDVHVISLAANYLDPQEAYSGDAAENSEIAARIDAWIEADLAGTDRAWKIVLMHQPAYPVTGDATSAAMRARWIPIFDSTGVDLVLCGHQHEFLRTFPLKGGTEDSGGLVQVMGNASPKSYETGQVAPEFAAFEMGGIAGWHKITATQDSLVCEAFDSTGKRLDFWEKQAIA